MECNKISISDQDLADYVELNNLSVAITRNGLLQTNYYYSDNYRIELLVMIDHRLAHRDIFTTCNYKEQIK